MPIEIRELLIKAVVQDVAPGSGTGNDVAAINPSNQLDEIVAACVEQVLNIIQEKSER